MRKEVIICSGKCPLSEMMDYDQIIVSLDENEAVSLIKIIQCSKDGESEPQFVEIRDADHLAFLASTLAALQLGNKMPVLNVTMIETRGN